MNPYFQCPCPCTLSSALPYAMPRYPEFGTMMMCIIYYPVSSQEPNYSPVHVPAQVPSQVQSRNISSSELEQNSTSHDVRSRMSRRRKSRHPPRCTYCGDYHQFENLEGRMVCKTCQKVKIFQPRLPPLCTFCDDYHQYNSPEGMICENCRKVKIFQPQLPPLCTYCNDYHQFESSNGDFLCGNCNRRKEYQSHIYCRRDTD